MSRKTFYERGGNTQHNGETAVKTKYEEGNV